MNRLVGLIIQTQKRVFEAEQGSVDPRDLLKEVRIASLKEIKDPDEFAAEVYYNFRRVEAAVYALKDEAEDRPLCLLALRWARGNRKLIRTRLTQVLRLRPSNMLEAFGKLWLEEKLRWALFLIDEVLPRWLSGSDEEGVGV